MSQSKSQLKLVSRSMTMTMSSVFIHGFPVTRSESNREPVGCGRTGNSQHEIYAGITLGKHVNTDQNLKGIFPLCCGIQALKNLDYFESKGSAGICIV